MYKTGNVVIFILSLFFFTHTLQAANKPQGKQKIDHKIYPTQIESHSDETPSQSGAKSIKPMNGYSAFSASASPGVVIGDTWYDQQHNGTIGRMIGWGEYMDTVGIHFAWMRLQQPSFSDRHYAYNHFFSTFGGSNLGGASAVQQSGDYGGYVGIDVTSDNEAVVGGHNLVGNVGKVQSQIYWDFTSMFHFFFDYSRVPDSVASFGYSSGLQSVIWPKFAYQEGTQTVTHVIAQVSAANAADPQAIYYFRKVGDTSSGSWDYPPYIVDTIYTLSHDIVADKNSDKVAIAWNANLTYTGVGNAQHPAGFQDDTLSGTSPVHVQWDNDVYYQVSNDQGATWEPRVNITKNRLGEAGFRAYTDISTLIDSNGDFHVIWTGPAWPEDPAADGWSGFYNRMFHWSENWEVVRTVASAEWSTPAVDTLIECVSGGWNMAISKMQLSECDGKLFAHWTQFLDPPNGVFDDCAERAFGPFGDKVGSVNGELFMTVSADYGLTWDVPRNLTNSYSAHCDPTNLELDCESDMWASMASHGRQNNPGEDWTLAEIVDPTGSYSGDYFLDVQYINDKDAGSIVKNEGTWTLSPVKWFRLACVEPLPNPQIILSISSVQFPTWANPGQTIALNLQIENTGNVDLIYSTTVQIDNNAGMNWLSLSGFTGLTPAGLANVETGEILLGSPTTTIGVYSGRVILSSNAPTSPDTIPIHFTVAEQIIEQYPDTIESACLALAVSNSGNYGNSGNGPSMDWTFSGAECDTTGAADVYLYDGSPVVLWIDGADTIANWSIFGDGWLSPNGFKPLGGEDSGNEVEYNWYNTGTFVTHDSTIGLSRTYYGSTDPSNCDFIVQKLEVWSYDGFVKDGITIGEAIDWDIPSDSGNQNESSFDVFSATIYQTGVEYGVDTLCQDSDTRFGGVAFFESYKNGSLIQSIPYNAFTGRADSLIYPAGNFVPGQLYTTMQNVGFFVEVEATDQFSVMTYDNNLTLNAGDTAVFWTVLATVQNGTVSDLTQAIEDGKQFIIDNDYFLSYTVCCSLRGDVNCNGVVDITDLVCFIEYSFGFGCEFCCDDNADVDANGSIDIADIVYLVNFMFGGGPIPPPC